MTKEKSSLLFYFVLPLIVIGGLIIYIASRPSTPSSTNSSEPKLELTNSSDNDMHEPKGGAITTETPEELPGDHVVEYTSSGFAPKNITIKKGESVTWVNLSPSKMWIASDVHPTHQILPEFDQNGSLENGGTYTFTFEDVGLWRYHNHRASFRVGSVNVVE